MKALVFRIFGGPEVLRLEEVPDPTPGPGEVLLANEAIGLNFADVYRRRGTYHLAGAPPYIAGYEAAGTVVALGEGVRSLAVGDRIGVADVPFANAERMRVPEAHAIPLPPDVSCEAAAACLLQGLTAQYLVEDSYPVREGTSALVHGAAGGVGQCLVQLARARGARVLGLVSSRAKAEVVLAAGAEQVLVRDDGWVAAARAFAPAGFDVVYDSVGRTLAQSLEAARDGGAVVFFGMAGGDPPLVDPRALMDRSLTLTGGDLWSYLTTREERSARAARLFSAMREGTLRLRAPTVFPLAHGAEAHALLESGRSSGKILLRPR
jgi:NADPH2:quinone reductase